MPKNLVLFASLVDDVLVFSNEGTKARLVAERVGRQRAMRLIDQEALPAVTIVLLGK